VLYVKDRGCTRPGCTAPPYCCQVHHVDEWIADGGLTDIDNETLACPADHGLLDKGWCTRKRKDGRTEWIPPPHLDPGQPRVNDFRHPQGYLKVPDHDEDDS
jgi:HNH endonuclease